MFLKKRSPTILLQVSQRAFLLFFSMYLALSFCSFLSSNIILYAFNINFFFYVALILGIIQIFLKRFVEDSDDQESEEPVKCFSLAGFSWYVALSLFVFLFAVNSFNEMTSGKYFVSVLISVSSFLFLLMLDPKGRAFSQVYGESDERVCNCTKFSKIFSLIIFFAFLTYFTLVSIVPSGTLSFSISPENNSRNVLEYTTGENILLGVTSGGEPYRLATETPVSLSLRIPRRFKSVNARITYMPSTSEVPVRLGTRNIYDGLSYLEIVNYDPQLASLPPYWQETRDGNIVVWQKNAEYERLYADAEQKKLTIKQVYDFEIDQLKTGYSSSLSNEAYSEMLEEIKRTYQMKLSEVENTFEEELTSKKLEPKYPSVSDFLADIKNNYGKTIGYHYPIEDFFSIDQDNSDFQPYQQTKMMRGGYSLAVFLPEPSSIDFSSTVVDTNKHEGPDEIKIAIFKDSEQIFEKIENDDGITEETYIITEPRTLEFSSQLLEAGMYELRIDTTYDVFTNSLFVSSPFVAFQEGLHVTEGQAYVDVLDRPSDLPVVVYTNSTKIQFNTAHAESLQTITVNGEQFTLTEVQTWIKKSDLPLVSTIYIPKGDVKLIGDGLFTFDQNSPLLTYREGSTNGLSEYILTGAEYIIANYPRPEQKDGWLIAEGTVEVPHIGFNNNTADIVFDFGTLGVDSKTVKIHAIEVTLTKDPITFSKIVEKIKQLF